MASSTVIDVSVLTKYYKKTEGVWTFSDENFKGDERLAPLYKAFPDEEIWKTKWNYTNAYCQYLCELSKKLNKPQLEFADLVCDSAYTLYIQMCKDKAKASKANYQNTLNNWKKKLGCPASKVTFDDETLKKKQQLFFDDRDNAMTHQRNTQRISTDVAPVQAKQAILDAINDDGGMLQRRCMLITQIYDDGEIQAKCRAQESVDIFICDAEFPIPETPHNKFFAKTGLLQILVDKKSNMGGESKRMDIQYDGKRLQLLQKLAQTSQSGWLFEIRGQKVDNARKIIDATRAIIRNYLPSDINAQTTDKQLGACALRTLFTDVKRELTGTASEVAQKIEKVNQITGNSFVTRGTSYTAPETIIIPETVSDEPAQTVEEPAQTDDEPDGNVEKPGSPSVFDDMDDETASETEQEVPETPRTAAKRKFSDIVDRFPNKRMKISISFDL